TLFRSRELRAGDAHARPVPRALCPGGRSRSVARRTALDRPLPRSASETASEFDTQRRCRLEYLKTFTCRGGARTDIAAAAEMMWRQRSRTWHRARGWR